MIMQLHVGLFGQQILLRTDVARVGYHPACRCVQTVSRLPTMKDMISTCFGVRLVGLVIAVMSVS